MRKDVTLALAGGAAYGIAHVGVLEVLEKHGFEIEGISGTSVGALVATLYAFGRSPAEMAERATDLSWPDITRPTLPRLGLLSMKRLREAVQSTIGEVDLADAPIPVRLVSTDLQSGEAYVFEKGPADLAVVASCSIPGLVEPVEWQDRLLVDGGLVDNLPVERARALGGGPVVAVDFQTSTDHPRPENLLEVLLRSVNIMVGGAASRQRDAADLLITPRVDSWSIADLSSAEEFLDAGRKAAEAALTDAGWI
jgi:NTE family protein